MIELDLIISESKYKIIQIYLSLLGYNSKSFGGLTGFLKEKIKIKKCS